MDLRAVLAERLARQGKSGWAAQEFAALAASGARKPDRTCGGAPPVSTACAGRGRWRVRALWYARDEVAARRDVAPGRVLPDAAIIAAAELDPTDERTLLMLPGFGGRSVRRLARTWLAALAEARELPDEALPGSPPHDGPPPPHRWAEKDPAAAGRLARCRRVVTEIAAAHRVPPENLITPEYVRRLAWEPPEEITPESVRQALAYLGARPWQTDLVAADLAAALLE